MSKGPGKIERAIADAFARQPSATFSVEDLGPICYPGLNQVEKKHRVAIIRAADKVAARMWWGRTYSSGVPCVYRNLCDLHSYALGEVREDYIKSVTDSRNQYRSVCVGGEAAFSEPDKNGVCHARLDNAKFEPWLSYAENKLAESEKKIETMARATVENHAFCGCSRCRVKLNTLERDGLTDTEEYRRLEAEVDAYRKVVNRLYKIAFPRSANEDDEA